MKSDRTPINTLARRGFLSSVAQGAVLLTAGVPGSGPENGIAAAASGTARPLDGDKSQTGNTPNALSATVQTNPF
jgi:hypothetical protein